MSAIHSVNCECGFSSTVSVGGLRATFRKKRLFPFYCKDCGLVDVNTAKKKLACPSCKSLEITAYGDESISKHTNKEIIPTIQCFEHRAFRSGNLCPICKKFTLNFEHADVLFD